MKSIVLAAPERHRVLGEMLSVPDSRWTAKDWQQYTALLRAEYQYALTEGLDRGIKLSVEEAAFADAIGTGLSVQDARKLAAILTKRLKDEDSLGHRERKRRKSLREAIHNLDGRSVLEMSRLHSDRPMVCLVCGKPLPRKHRRAFCSSRCRQKAYRLRNARLRKTPRT